MPHVANIEILAMTLPFRFSFTHALASRDESTNVVVRLTLSNGIVGWGEGVPRDYVTGETVDSAVNAIETRFGPAVLGKELPAADGVPAWIESLLPFPVETDGVTDGAARCAIELALIDAGGRTMGRSAASWIGGRKVDHVTYDAIIPFSSPRKLAGLAIAIRAAGLKNIKLKAGDDPERDRANLTVLRRILGRGANIRIDANAAWTTETAPKRVRALRKFRLSAVEQPVAAKPAESMTAVTSAVTELVIADESLRTVAEAEALARDRGCDAFNIRVSKCGGLLPSRKIAAVAAESHMVTIVGAQVGESGILSAAGRILAGAIGPRWVEGSAGKLLLKEDIVVERIIPGYRGRAKVFDGPGLGVTVSEDAIRSHSVRRALLSTDSDDGDSDREGSH